MVCSGDVKKKDFIKTKMDRKMKLASIAGRKFFHPAQHLWLRANKLSAASHAYSWQVEVGLTQRGLQDIGDISKVMYNQSLSRQSHNRKTDLGWKAQTGDPLLSIEWECHSISSADELYHTVWESISETTHIKSPVSGTIQDVYTTPPDKEEMDEDTVLARILAPYESLQEQLAELMSEEQYQNFVDRTAPGKFGPVGV